MTYTTTTLTNVLKSIYDGQGVKKLVHDEGSRPFFSRLKKNKNLGGLGIPLPVIYSDGTGISPSFTTGQANAGASSIAQFVITHADPLYSFAQIETEALLAARSDKQAFLNSLTHSIDSALNALANNVESALFRNGSGAIGRISSLGDSNTSLTLTSVDDVVNYAVGMKIVAAQTEDSALRSSTAGTISAVDRDTGKITFSASIPSTFDGYASTNDYLFLEGTYTTAGDRKMIRGLDAWFPATAPSSGDSFFTQDRSADPSKLAGVRYAGNSASIEQSIIGATARLGRQCGVKSDLVLMSHDTYRLLNDEMGSKVQRGQGGKAIGGFSGLEVIGLKGPIECLPATFCQSDVMWLLSMESLTLYSMGDAIQILDQDGKKICRRDAADKLETRCACFANLGCNAPGHNVRISL